MSDYEYHNHQAFSNSGIKDLLESPAHYKERTFKGSSAARIGSAFHQYLLTPNTIEEDIVVYPGKEKTLEVRSEAKIAEINTFKEEHKTKLVLTQAELDEAENLYNEQPSDLKQFFATHTRNEIAIIGEFHGIPVKCKIDAYDQTSRLIYDPKTTTSMQQFNSGFYDKGYHTQAYFYTLMAELAGLKVDDFVFMVFEKSAPYGCKGKICDPEVLEDGKEDFEKAFKIYAECYKSNDWSQKYSEDFDVIRRPYWRRKKTNTPQLSLVK
jgi:hypothetical protein